MTITLTHQPPLFAFQVDVLNASGGWRRRRRRPGGPPRPLQLRNHCELEVGTARVGHRHRDLQTGQVWGRGAFGTATIGDGVRRAGGPAAAPPDVVLGGPGTSDGGTPGATGHIYGPFVAGVSPPIAACVGVFASVRARGGVSPSDTFSFITQPLSRVVPT